MSDRKDSNKSSNGEISYTSSTDKYKEQFLDIKLKPLSKTKRKNAEIKQKILDEVKEHKKKIDINHIPTLKPVIIRPLNNFILETENIRKKYSKEIVDRKIEVKKLLLSNKQASVVHKLLNILHKIYLKSEKSPILINQRLFMNLSRILNVPVTEELLSQSIDFIGCPDLISINKHDTLEINKKKYDQNLYEKKIDEIFIDKLTEKYKKTLKIIENKTKIEQEKFELELKKKNINLNGDFLILNPTTEGREVTKNIKERMNSILFKLQSKKLKKIESFSDNSLIRNIKYIFEVENKTRLSLNFINEKLQIQDPLHSSLTRETADLLFKNNEKENETTSACEGFQILEMYNEIFIERLIG